MQDRNQGGHGKPRGSIVMKNWHLTIMTSNSVITQSFRSRESTFCLNFHTANCLLNSIKLRKFSVYNFDFHNFNCTLTAYWLQRIVWCSIFHKKIPGAPPPPPSTVWFYFYTLRQNNYLAMFQLKIQQYIIS